MSRSPSLIRLSLAILLIATFSSTYQIIQCQRPTGIYIDNGMGQTIAHNVNSQREKRNIARDILHMLQLPPVPATLKTYSNESFKINGAASRYIHNVYKYALNQNEADGHVESAKIIKDSDVVVSYGASTTNLRNKNNVLLKFDLSETPTEVEAVIGAALRLYLKHRRNDFVVTVHASTRSTNKTSQQQRHRRRAEFIDSIELNNGAKGWIELDVTKALRYWILRGDRTASLQLTIDTPLNGTRQLLELREEPFLLGYFKSTAQLRQAPTAIANRWKRSSGDLRAYAGKAGYRKASAASCKMHTLYVRFRELEFDRMIVAPDGYDAQFCAGECRFPLSGNQNATNHAIVQTLVHFLQPGRVPQACCVPTKLDSLPVLYSREKGTLVLKRYHNMVIKGCGCQ